jgi:hypothetical protein
MHQIGSLPYLLSGVLIALDVYCLTDSECASSFEVEEIVEPGLELYCDQPVYLVEDMLDLLLVDVGCRKASFGAVYVLFPDFDA